MTARLDRRDRRRPNRWRRYRSRRNAGLLVAPVEVDGAVLDMLIATRWLDECDAHDRGKVGLAIARLLADAARR